MELLQGLGARVVELRRRQGLSRESLAKKSGLSARFLAEVESGRGNISLTRLSDLSNALEVPLAMLLASLPQAKKNGKDMYSSILSMLSKCNETQLEEAHLWLSQHLDQKRTILALIGLHGAGKTTIGKKVAAALRWKFVELDELIEKAAGLTLQNIFEVHGEEYYRRLEREVLLDFLVKRKRGVLATGGGIVTREETYDLLRQHCLTFWLRADPVDHWNRVLQQDPRPITNYPNAFAQLQNLLERREPLYSRADFEIDTSMLGIKRSVECIVSTLRSSTMRLGPKT